MSLLPNTAIPTTWVKGKKTQSGNSDWVYKNHCYSACGDAQGVPPCMVSYYVNNTDQIPPYSILDLATARHNNASNDKVTYTSTCPNYSLCPVIGGIASQVQWDNSNAQCDMMRGNSATLACLYPLATFQDEINVDQFVREFGENDDYNNVILPYFCSSQLDTKTGTQVCPIDPATNLPMSTCSQIVSNSRCRDWITNMQTSGNQSSVDIANNTLNSYCATYNSPDCLCINRQLSPVYQVLRLGQPCPDSCWWSPCQDTTQVRYLVPTEGLTPCDCTIGQYCPSVNAVVGGNSENLSFDPNQYTTCTQNVNGGGNGNGPSGPTNGGRDIWSNWWWLIILVTVVVVVIVILIIILL